MDRSLPAHPNLAQLRRQAKELCQRRRAGDPDALARFRAAHPRLARPADEATPAATVALNDAQLVLAREHGFASWPKLKQHVEGLERVEARVVRLRQAFAAADQETRDRLLSCVHTKERFQDYDPEAAELSERDARLVVANEEGYPFWRGYEIYLHLDPAVRQVIAAAGHGELARLQALLRASPGAANPRWAPGFTPERLPMLVIPLNCVAVGVFEGQNRRGNDYQLARALIRAGAEIEIDNGGPLKTAVSYAADGAVRALLEAGAAADGPDGDGMPMAYALGFGFTEIAETLARFGAQLDLRFAAGLGKLDEVQRFVNPDGSLTPDAGWLADPFENRFRCERTRANILCQALSYAARHARLETVEYLLALGADADQEVPGANQLGGATLHHLTAGAPLGASGDPHRYDERRLPVVERLLRHGASVTSRDSRFHSTPLGWAAHHGATRIFDALRPHAGAHDAAQFGLEDRLQALLAAAPALANARDTLGRTPLHCLASATPTVKSSKIIELLVARGADPGARDNAGRTPYEQALATGRAELAERLRLQPAASGNEETRC